MLDADHMYTFVITASTPLTTHAFSSCTHLHADTIGVGYVHYAIFYESVSRCATLLARHSYTTHIVLIC